MVSTRNAKKSRRSAKGDSSPVDSGGEYEEPAPESNKTGGKKRVRTTKTTVKDKVAGKRQKRAKLSMLPEMPIDILYEIFSLVHPKDLLHISWTAKVLNGFLTRKSSRHVWQASFDGTPERERPPPCPSELTEMAYANLVYGRYCTNCADDCPTIPAWNSFVRICGPCVGKIAVNLPSGSTFGFNYDRMNEILPSFCVKYGSHRTLVYKVLCSDLNRFKQELAAAGKSSRDTLKAKWKSLVREREEFSDAMDGLKRLEEEAREEARANIQQRRIDRIWEKLSEEGWGEEIAIRKAKYGPGLLEFKGVTMMRPLGEKAWAELRDPLHKFMKEKSEGIHGQIVADRCQSRIKQVQEIATSFHFSLPHPHDFHPSAADICWIPEVRKTILDGTDAEFQDCIDDIQSRISELSATWLEERRNTFLRLLPQDPPTPMHLSLATTIFDCERCHKSPMHIEEALYHYCYSSEGDILRGTKFLDYRIQPNYNHDIGSPWNPRVAKYSYSATLAALIREIVLECGENPDTITTQEMNRKHHRFVRFDNYQSTIIVRNWVQAIEDKRIRARIHRRFLQPHELPEFEPEQEERGGYWGCLRCWGTDDWSTRLYDQRFKVIKDHLALSHQIENPTEEDCFNINPNYTAPLECRFGKGN